MKPHDPHTAALAIIDQLTADHLAYALCPHGHDGIGFAALHDFCDANMLLPGTDELEEFLDTDHSEEDHAARMDAECDRASAVIAAFNHILLEGGWDSAKVMKARSLVKSGTIPSLDALRAPFESPAGQFSAVGFQHEETGGGCTALIRRFDNGIEIMLTDGKFGAPGYESPITDPVEMLIYFVVDGVVEHFGSRDFVNSAAAFEFFDAVPMRQAVAKLATLDPKDGIPTAIEETDDTSRAFNALVTGAPAQYILE